MFRRASRVPARLARTSASRPASSSPAKWIAGDEMMRSLLYEAAQVLLTRVKRWSSLKAWAMRISRRRGHKKAIIALARRIAVILHRMWIDGTEFDWDKKPEAAPPSA